MSDTALDLPETRLVNIFNILQKKAYAFTHPADADDFASDAYMGIIEDAHAGKIDWSKDDMYIVIRGCYIARRLRSRERRRKTQIHSFADSEFMGAVIERDGIMEPTGYDASKDIYWYEIAQLSEQLPKDVIDLFGLIVEGITTGKAEISKSGAIRQSWLCKQTGSTSSTMGRRMAKIRDTFAPLALA